MPSTDRLSYDTAVSAQVQADITGIVARLESTIDERSTAGSVARISTLKTAVRMGPHPPR